MMRRLVLSLVGLAWAGAAQAATPALPTLALDPQPPSSIWNGLYVGTEIVGVSSRGFGRKGAHGGFGGAILAGYDHEFANNIVLGVQASAGYMPLAFPFGRARGYNYAATDVKVGYDMGRWMPYLTTGVVLAKPNTGPGMGYIASDSVNDLINGTANLKAAARVGAGVEYAITNTLHVGVAVSFARDQGLLTP